MLVTSLDESAIYAIGHAFGYYNYGTESGLVSLFKNQEAAATYIRGYARGMLRGGFLHATSPRGEGFIAYKLPGEKLGLKVGLPLMQGVFASMTLPEIARFLRLMSHGGPGLRDRMDKEKKPYIFVGMVCVPEAYQGQGYMRKVMELAFAEGSRLQLPVILDTDARSKCDKYVHLGMELAGTRSFGAYGTLYDLIKYPDPAGAGKGQSEP